MFDRFLESSHQDVSSKLSNMGFGEEITQLESFYVILTNLIWSSSFVHTENGMQMK